MGNVMGETMAAYKRTKGKGKSQETEHVSSGFQRGTIKGTVNEEKDEILRGGFRWKTAGKMEMHTRRKDGLTGAVPEKGSVHWV
jgi:hypothetical protein